MSILNPVWIKPASITKKSLDPLGLDRVSDRLTSNMLVGITSLTTRARYYSFYVWAIKNVNETENIKNFNQFENAFYDRIRAYSLACVAHENNNPDGDHSSIQGKVKSKPKWRNADKNVGVHGFRHLPGNRLGGYGYYYQTSIRRLGLAKKEQVKDVLTPLGAKLAEFFEKEIIDTRYYKEFLGRDAIPKSVLIKYGSKSCVCLICKKNASDRDPLKDIILGMNPEAKNNTYHQRRQDTLVQILYSLDFLNKYSETIDEEVFLDIAYFGQFFSRKKVREIVFPSKIRKTVEKWKLFRSHDYFSYACESLFHIFLELLDIHRSTGLSYSDLMNLLDKSEYVNEISSILNTKLKGSSSKELALNDVLIALVTEVDEKANEFDSRISKNFDSSCNLNSGINEHLLTLKIIDNFGSEEFDYIKSTVWASLVLLLIFARFYWRSKTQDPAWKWLIVNTEGDLSPSYFVYHLGQKLANIKFTMFDYLKWIYNDFVLTQAENIYNQKVGSSLYSRPVSWFHSDGGVYRIDKQHSPRFRNSRFASCLSILSDLSLCKTDGKNHRLTINGKKVLKELGIEVE